MGNIIFFMFEGSIRFWMFFICKIVFVVDYIFILHNGSLTHSLVKPAEEVHRGIQDQFFAQLLGNAAVGDAAEFADLGDLDELRLRRAERVA